MPDISVQFKIDDFTNERAKELSSLHNTTKSQFLSDLVYIAISQYWDEMESDYIEHVKEEISDGVHPTVQMDPTEPDPLSNMSRAEGEAYIEAEIDSLGEEPKQRCDQCGAADFKTVEGVYVCNRCDNFWSDSD